jgi:hypothetical protein
VLLQTRGARSVATAPVGLDVQADDIDDSAGPIASVLAGPALASDYRQRATTKAPTQHDRNAATAAKRELRAASADRHGDPA